MSDQALDKSASAPVPSADDGGKSRHRTRRTVAAILTVLTVVSLTADVPGAWVRRTVFNTDRYAATVAPLPQDPAVQEYLARTITTQVFLALDVQSRLETTLSTAAPKLEFLAGPITNAVQGYVTQQVQKLIASDTFQQLWIDANRLAQQGIVTVLNGDSAIVNVVDGKVSLNLLPIINQALSQVSGFASNLLGGRTIDLPTITADQAQVAIAALSAATGVDLPSNFGQVVVFDASNLSALQTLFAYFNRLVISLAILSLLFFAAAMWASLRRRRTLLQVMASWAVILVIERRGALALADHLVAKAKPENQAAMRVVVDQFQASLRHYTGLLLAVSLIVVVVALLTGPYSWAVKFRNWIRSLIGAVAGVARGADATEGAVWVAAHSEGLMIAGAVVGAAIMWVLSLSVAGFLMVAAILGLFEVGVYRVAAALKPPGPGADEVAG